MYEINEEKLSEKHCSERLRAQRETRGSAMGRRHGEMSRANYREVRVHTRVPVKSHNDVLIQAFGREEVVRNRCCWCVNSTMRSRATSQPTVVWQIRFTGNEDRQIFVELLTGSPGLMTDKPILNAQTMYCGFTKGRDESILPTGSLRRPRPWHVARRGSPAVSAWCVGKWPVQFTDKAAIDQKQPTGAFLTSPLLTPLKSYWKVPREATLGGSS